MKSKQNLDDKAATRRIMVDHNFQKRYKIIDRIGEGSFSQVVKCLDTKTGAYVAVKTLKKRYDTWNEASELAELVTMQRIPSHPNLLSMLGVHYDIFMGTVTFIFDLMDMSLYDYMESKKRCIPESRAKYYLYQVLSGLHHLYKFGVFHRDIKPENILMKIPLHTDLDIIQDDDQYCEQIKIGDLGSVKPIRSLPPYTEYISTRWYRSPECLLTKGYYESKMDIWAAGCVFYEMLTTKPLFAGVNEVDQLLKIHQILGTPSNRTFMKFKRHKSCNWDKCPKIVGTGLSPLLSNLSADGAHLMKMMITYDPEYRATIKQLLNHRYFNNLRKNNEINKSEKSSESFSRLSSKVKQTSSATYRKMPQKRSICDNRNSGSNLYSSFTESNLLTCNENVKMKNERELNFYPTKHDSTAKMTNPERKYPKQVYENSNYSGRYINTDDYTKIQNMQIRKDFKSKTQELTKNYYDKHNMLTSVTDANTYKPPRAKKFHDYHRTEIKRNIETTRHNFENYNEIMKRIESKRNINPERSINDYTNNNQNTNNQNKNVKKYYTPSKPNKYDDMKKTSGSKKRIIFSPAQRDRDHKRYQQDNHQQRNNNHMEQMDADNKVNTTKIVKPIHKLNGNVNSTSKCYMVAPRPRKRLEPIDEVIEPKRQKLFQVEASIRNLSKYMDSTNVRKIL